ncbi:MAG: hypothetical protein VX366_07105 [Candidatus Thermoplasmatota archaeon]|nr:hypothetical protein [Candidatus Thermoplasmatota archaeon]
MVDEVLVESWAVCSGWVEEFCINTQDYIDGHDFGVAVFVKSDDGNYIDEPFGMRPMCNYHLNNGEFPHPSGGGVFLTRQTWELLVQMCGYLTEEEGEVCFEADLIKPTLEPFWNTDRRSYADVTPQGEVLEYAKQAAIALGLIE